MNYKNRYIKNVLFFCTIIELLTIGVLLSNGLSSSVNSEASDTTDLHIHPMDLLLDSLEPIVLKMDTIYKEFELYRSLQSEYSTDVLRAFKSQVELSEKVVMNTQNEKLLGVSIDAVVSAAIAIFVLGLGLLINRRYDSFRKYNHLKTVEQYSYSLYQDLKKSTNERIESFNKLIAQLKVKHHKDIEMEYIVDYSVNSLNKINWDDYYAIFTSLKNPSDVNKVDIYRKINKGVSIIDRINSHWINSYNEFLDRQLTYERRWHDAIQNIGNIIDEFVHENHGKKLSSLNQFDQELDKILRSHQTTKGSSDIYVAMNSLIDPLHSHIKKQPKEKWGQKLLGHVMSCIYAYDNYDNNREVYEDQFANFNKRLMDSLDLVNKNVKLHSDLIDDKPSIMKLWKW